MSRSVGCLSQSAKLLRKLWMNFLVKFLDVIGLGQETVEWIS